jgi:hypothetical protein
MGIANKSFLFLLLALCFSCEEQVFLCFGCDEQGFFANCDECLAKEPFKTNLEVKIDINFTFATTLITVYEGNLEDSLLYVS